MYKTNLNAASFSLHSWSDKLILFTHAYHNSLLICKVGRQLSNIAVNDVVAFPSSYPVDLDPGHFCSHLDF